MEEESGMKNVGEERERNIQGKNEMREEVEMKKE